MQTHIGLDAYFERIGYDGPRRPALENLQAIHLNHVQTIAFENLNPLLKWPVALDAASLEQKLVLGGRGGYCYEQNLIFSDGLTALGFEVTGLLARVLWTVPEGVITPRSHMVLLVKLDGRAYIADVGFGAMTLTAPLRLEPDIEQQTPHELFRLVERNGDWTLQARIRDVWKSLYQFDLTPQYLPDYEVCNWYTSTHPKSHFVTDLMAAMPAAGCRYTLHNNEFAVHYLDGRTERRTLASAAELREVLSSGFSLALPDAPELEPLLDRLTRSQGQT